MFDLIDVVAAAVAPATASEVANHNQLVDWVTVLVSLVVGVFGGLIGALITSSTQKKLAKDAAKATASSALWNFQRAIRDFAAEAEGHWVKDRSYFTNTTREHLELARRDAYPYRGYLGSDFERLVGRNDLGDDSPYGDPMDDVSDWFQWSTALEERLNVVFRREVEKEKRGWLW